MPYYTKTFFEPPRQADLEEADLEHEVTLIPNRKGLMAAEQAGTQLQWNSQHGLMATVEANSKSFDKREAMAREYGGVAISDNFQGNKMQYAQQGVGGAATAVNHYQNLKQNIATNDQNFNIYPDGANGNTKDGNKGGGGNKRAGGDSLNW